MNLWIVLSQAAADPWGVSRMGQGRTEIVTPRACDDQSGETLDVLIGLALSSLRPCLQKSGTSSKD